MLAIMHASSQKPGQGSLGRQLRERGQDTGQEGRVGAAEKEDADEKQNKKHKRGAERDHSW